MKIQDVKIGRNDPCPCGELKPDGKPKKYKNCCLNKETPNKKKMVKMTISRRDFISGPYKQCPKCLRKSSFGVFIPTSGTHSYSRECVECGHKQGYPLPKIKKKILYLDQFVISNLIKFLDKDHPSHEKIKKDPFWKELFIKLEAASKSQAIVCPDSFYHRDESLVGSTDFKLMKRLYEHFSSGKTLHSGNEIQRMQIYEHFEKWLQGQKAKFNSDPKYISSEDLDTWSVGLHITVNMRPFPGEVDNLRATNTSTREQLKNIWSMWQSEKDFKFTNKVKEETLGLGKGLISVAQKFQQKRADAMKKMESGEDYTLDLNDILPPESNGILDDLLRLSRTHGISEENLLGTIIKYFNDVDALLEIPKIRISSVMFAGLARRAQMGKKEPPKSFTDVEFISSYLPYCDAMFVDIESATILKEPPKEIPLNLKLKEFPAKIFSLNQKKEFLDYLDQLVKKIPAEQMEILKDVTGDNHDKPYWDIIEHEKRERD